MRLLSKTTLLILTVSIVMFLFGNIVFFQISKEMINKHIDAELVNQMHNIIAQINKDESLFQITKFSDEVVIKTIDVKQVQNPRFSDTVLFNAIQKRYIPHRSLKFSYLSKSNNQLVTVYKSLLSSDKLIERITISSIFMVIGFIIMIYVLNRYIFVNVWSNFFTSLKKIEKYDIKSISKISFQETEIEEFEKLNKVLSTMVNRIQQDYRNLKELTANTSHEIQTPLAIIKSKAEMLLQSENLSEQEMEDVYSILNTSDRLSKLSQSLLLITKIENDQFEDSESVDVKNVIEKHMKNFELLLQGSELQLTSSIISGQVIMNPVLLDILVLNLIKNAVIHSPSKAKINVIYAPPFFTVINDGVPLPFPSDQIFNRFARGSTNQNSVGLGLEIVKKITNYYSIAIIYNYTNMQHYFKVDFSNISN